jgi:hypothetical protein
MKFIIVSLSVVSAVDRSSELYYGSAIRAAWTRETWPCNILRKINEAAPADIYLYAQVLVLVPARNRVACRARSFCENAQELGEKGSLLSFAQRHADQVGYVLGAELCHEMGAMGFESARADSQPMPALLVGTAAGDQGQYLMLPWRQ